MVRAVKHGLSKVAHSLIPPCLCQPGFTSGKFSSFIFWQGGILLFLSPSICFCCLQTACSNMSLVCNCMFTIARWHNWPSKGKKASVAGIMRINYKYLHLWIIYVYMHGLFSIKSQMTEFRNIKSTFLHYSKCYLLCSESILKSKQNLGTVSQK